MAILAPTGGRAANDFARGRQALMLVSFLLALASAPPLVADGALTKEFEVKAVFLFNFTQFVEWPPTAFDDGQSPLVIGVLGDDPFGAALDAAVRGEKAHGHPLVVARYRRVEEATGCHLLYVNLSDPVELARVFAVLHDRCVLTVGDSEGFALHGGMVRFFSENKRIRLRINLAAAKAAKLTISSKLLRPAQVVMDEKD